MGPELAARLRQIAGPFDDEMARVCIAAARAIERLALELEEEREVADRLARTLGAIDWEESPHRDPIVATLNLYVARRAR